MSKDLYIDTAAALDALCGDLRNSPWIALDTEFIRERTYYPQLCLLQVANEGLVACIDPLTLTDLDPLMNVLYDPAITKVLHSAKQDLEIFFHLRGTLPRPVFDTQIAATLLGHGEQVGYATLVKDLFDVDVDKSQTRTDWSRRPLEPAQLAYAAADVSHLRDLYRRQRAELEARDRLAWLADDFDELCQPTTYRVDLQEVWRRIKGNQQLRGVQLAVLRALAAWREERAIAANRPRKWILGDDVLLELARHMPKDLERLKRVRGLESGFVQRYGPALLELIAGARGEPREHWPVLPARRRLSAEQDALVDAMMAVIRLRGGQKAISPSSLASRKDLERLLTGDTEVPLVHGWRAAIVGCEVQALLRGDLRIEVHDAELRIVASA